jgi:hypothetical protein
MNVTPSSLEYYTVIQYHNVMLVNITPSFPQKGGNPVNSLPNADLAVPSTRDRPALSIVSSRFFPISWDCFAVHGSFSWIPALAGMSVMRE